MSAKPRIALVTPDLHQDGGVQRVALWLYRTIQESGEFEPSLISLATARTDRASRRLAVPGTWWRGPAVTTGKIQGIDFVHVGCNWAEWEAQRFQPRGVLSEMLDAFDIVQVVAGSPAWTLAARARPPVLLQVASMIRVERHTVLQRARGLRWWYERINLWFVNRCDRAGLRAADTVFVENRWMRRLAEQLNGVERTVFAPPGIDTERFTPAAVPNPRSYLLCVGRLGDVRKNYRLLFEAYAKLRARCTDAPALHLAGLGELLPADRDHLVRLGLEAYVTIHRNLSLEKLAEVYRAAAAFVLSSDEEGFGLVLVEAMASGLPVVSTACGGSEEIVEEGVTGFLTPVGDAEALADRLRRLWESPAMALAMGRASRARAVSVFSLRVTGGRFLDEYRRRTGGRSRAGQEPGVGQRTASR